MLRSRCKLDLAYFPYDDQKCDLVFGSFEYSSNQLELFPAHEGEELLDLDEYEENEEWLLNGVSVHQRTKTYHCRNDDYSELVYALKMMRHSTSHTLNLIIPCTLISCVGLLVFLLPEESGEKIGLCITVLLALTVFQQLTAESLPPHGTPYVTQYYLILVVFTSLTLMVTVVALSFHHSDAHAPRFMRMLVIGCLGTILCVHQKRKPLARTVRPYMLRDVVFSNDIVETGSTVGKQLDKIDTESTSERASEEISPHEEEEDNHQAWLEINRVLNRFFFIVFLSGIIVSFMFLFAQEISRNYRLK